MEGVIIHSRKFIGSILIILVFLVSISFVSADDNYDVIVANGDSDDLTAVGDDASTVFESTDSDFSISELGVVNDSKSYSDEKYSEDVKINNLDKTSSNKLESGSDVNIVSQINDVVIRQGTVNVKWQNEGNSLKFILKDSTGKAVSGEQLKLIIDENDYYSTTNELGSAEFNVRFVSTGETNFTITFDGDENYNECSLQGLIFVRPSGSYDDATTINIDEISSSEGYIKATLRLMGELDDEDNTVYYEGDPISNVEVTYSINGVVGEQTLTTDDNGQFSLIVSESSTVIFSYAGDDSYSPSNRSVIIVLDEISHEDLIATSFSGSDISTFALSETSFSVFLRDSDGNALSGALVNMILNDEEYSNVTDARGVAIFTFALKNADDYFANVSFEGNNYYAPSSSIFKITVNKLDVNLSPYGLDEGENFVFDVEGDKIISLILKTQDREEIDTETGESFIIVGEPIVGKIIRLAFTSEDEELDETVFDSDEILIYESETDEFGVANFNIGVSVPGNYKYIVYFAGDDSYNQNKYLQKFYVAGEPPKGTELSYDIDNSLIDVVINGISTKGNVLKVTLKDSEGNVLVGEEIRLLVNGGYSSALTNMSGVAQLPIAFNYGETLSFELSYAGKEGYNSSNMIETLSIPKANTRFSTSNPSIKAYPNLGYFTFTLNDAKGTPLAAKKVTYNFNGKQYNATTNINGQVTFKISVSKAASYTITGKFVGDSQYAGSSFTKTIKVSKNSVKFASPTKKVKKSKDKKAQFKITLKTSNNILLAKKLVYIKINKKTYKIKTNAKGVATFKLKLPKVKKTYKYKLTFKGDSSNNKKTYSGSLKVY